MSKLKATVAGCLALSVIGGIVACSSQPAKSGGDAKSSSSPSEPARLPSRLKSNHRRPGLTQRHHHHWRKTTPAAGPEFRRCDQRESLRLQTVVGATRRAAERRAECAAHHDGRLRLWLTQHLWRRHPDAGPGSRCEERAALHEFPLHIALLADPRGLDHRAQPPRCRLWGRGGNCHGVSGL